MGTTNKYTDTKSVDYLEAIKRNQLEARNAKTAASNFDVKYMLPVKSAISLTNTVSNIEGTLGDYEVVDNSAYQILFLPMDYDVKDAINSNNGTVTGTETYVAGPEISSSHPLRKAFSFDGASYITLANESNFDFERTSPFSVSFWVKMGSVAADQGLVMKSADITTGIGWGINFNNTGDTISFKLADGTTSYAVSGTTVFTTTIWNHIVCTYDGSSNKSGMKIYVNGTLEATGTASAISGTLLNNSSVVIGAESDAGSKFTGSMDDIQVWNIELSQANITDIHSGKQLNYYLEYNIFLTEAGVTIVTEADDTLVTEVYGILNPAVIGLSDVT